MLLIDEDDDDGGLNDDRGRRFVTALTCACGQCGQPVPPGTRFIRGHHVRVMARDAGGQVLQVHPSELPLCACNCGERVLKRGSHFRRGHGKRLRALTTHAAEAVTFAGWLRRHVVEDGRALRAIHDASGVNHRSISAVQTGRSTTMSEDSARRLAALWGDDPDEIAALAGYADRRIAVPDPLAFGSIGDWLDAALEARGENASQASLRMGKARDTLRHIKSGRVRYPWRKTLDALASYFNVDHARLRALLAKSPKKAAATRARVRTLGPEYMAEFRSKGRAMLTPEIRQKAGRLGGAVAGLKNVAMAPPNKRKQFSTSGINARKRNSVGRGYFTTDGLARMRIAARANSRAAMARIGVENHPAVKALRAQPHQQLGMLGWIWSRVKLSEDEKLKARVLEQKRAQMAYLRQPRRRGKPPTLLRDKDLAINAAVLYDDVGLPAREIGEMAEFKVSKDQRGYLSQVRSAWDLIRLGRALRHYPPSA